MSKLTLVEDDPILGRALVLTLESSGYQVEWFQSVTSFKQSSYLQQKSELMILDIGLPDGDGITLLKEIRQEGFKIPVIFLTARDHEDTVVEGFNAGANDYIKKPFSNKELVARIKSFLKEPAFSETKIKLGPLQILVEKRKILFAEQEIELNRRHFDILMILAQRPGVAITREHLIQSIKRDGEMFDRTIDSHISHLRSSLKKHGIDCILINSIYGVGYRLEVVERETL